MHSHRVSVIVPTYNRAALIGRALESVIAQTAPVHEIIVVDDGSDDGTRDVVCAFVEREPRLKYVVQNRAGAPAARNRGIAMATGSVIAFQDSDDEWRPEFLETLLKYHDRPGVVAFTSMLTIDGEGNRRVEFPHKIEDVSSMLAARNCISTQTALLDVELFKFAQFDVDLPRLQDWDLWLGLIGHAHFVHHPEPLVVQHIQHDSITAGSVNLYIALRAITSKHWRVLVRHPLSFLRLWFAARAKTSQLWGR